jgi:hypothetical protein
MDATNSERAAVASPPRGAQRRCCWPPIIRSACAPPRSSPSFFSVSQRSAFSVHDSSRATRAMDRHSVAASWLKFTGAHGRSDYQDFVEWFVRQVFNTPLDPADRGRDRLRAPDAETLIASVLGNLAAQPRADRLSLAPRTLPVLLISLPTTRSRHPPMSRALYKQRTGGC